MRKTSQIGINNSQNEIDLVHEQYESDVVKDKVIDS